METLSVNLAGKTRTETLHGREYLVVPMSLIVPGVLNGSKGPLFYPEDEIKKNPDNWNGMPIVVDHPTRNGQPVSARSPEVLEQSQVGTVFNASVNGKLTAEGWFDVERTETVDSRILNKLKREEPVELSTGLFTTNLPAEPNAVFNNTTYTSIATNYRPDHLAVFVDKVGACSLNDGCGVLVNADQEFKRSADGKFSNSDGGEKSASGVTAGDTKAFNETLSKLKNGDSITLTVKGATHKGKVLSITGTTNKKLMFSSDKDNLKRTIRSSDVGPQKVSLTANQESLMANSFAFTPSEDPLTWDLPIDSPESIRESILALNSSEIPEEELPEVKRRITTAWKTFHPHVQTEDIPKVVANQLSHGILYEKLSRLLRDVEPVSGSFGDGVSPEAYIVDVFDKYIIYRTDKGELFQRSYTTDLRSDQVDLKDDKKSVQKVEKYIVANQTLVVKKPTSKDTKSMLRSSDAALVLSSQRQEEVFGHLLNNGGPVSGLRKGGGRGGMGGGSAKTQRGLAIGSDKKKWGQNADKYRDTTAQITGKNNISVTKISSMSNDRQSGQYKKDNRGYTAVRSGENSFVLTGDYEELG